MSSHLSFFILFCGLMHSSLGKLTTSVFLNSPTHQNETEISETGILVQKMPMPEGYISIPGVGKYKLHMEVATWNDARRICMREGGHLAIINSFTEADALKNMLQKSGNITGGSSNFRQAYLGIHDKMQEDEWQTIFGVSLYKTGYCAWSFGCGPQPDGGSNQNCGSLMELDGGLNDIECSALIPFFCELPTNHGNRG